VTLALEVMYLFSAGLLCSCAVLGFLILLMAFIERRDAKREADKERKERCQ